MRSPSKYAPEPSARYEGPKVTPNSRQRRAAKRRAEVAHYKKANRYGPPRFRGFGKEHRE